jgi:hypothetical protein
MNRICPNNQNKKRHMLDIASLRRLQQKTRSAVVVWLLAKLCDAMSQSGNLPAGGILVNDAFLGRPHNDGLAIIKRRLGARAIARGDGFFNLDHGGAQTRTAGLIDDRAARDLAGRLAG